MKRLSRILAMLLFLGPSLWAEETPWASVSALIENSSKWDGGNFKIRGEFIGERLTVESDGSWFNIS